MDKHDYHFISIKFLTAILFAVFFAFLLIYVFKPEAETDFKVYSINKKNQTSSNSFFTAAEADSLTSAVRNKELFIQKLRRNSFAILDQTKKTTLSLLTASYSQRLDSLQKEKNLEITNLIKDLEEKEESLLQKKRKELEQNLSAQLNSLRNKIKKDYANFNQKEIRANYLAIINLRFKIELVAKNEKEKEKYEKQLQKVKTKQDKVLKEKNMKIDNNISKQTRDLIMEINTKYTNYRDQINNKHQQIIAKKRKEISTEVDQSRSKLKAELNSLRQEKRIEVEKLIAESKEKFY